MVLTNIVCFFDGQNSVKTVDCMVVHMRMVSFDLKALCYVNVMYMKKICTKFWVLIGDFPRSPSPVRGFWKYPRAAPSTPCSRASAPASVLRVAPHSGPRAHRAALGDFQNPLRAQGIWVKIPSQKPDFSIYISILEFGWKAIVRFSRWTFAAETGIPPLICHFTMVELSTFNLRKFYQVIKNMWVAI